MTCRSDKVKIRKNTPLKITPATVASDLVNRFTIAVMNSTAEIAARPTGISTLPMCRLPGTFHSRLPGSVKRSTSTASDFMAKLQITPKA